jgi:hypothetical protein
MCSFLSGSNTIVIAVFMKRDRAKLFLDGSPPLKEGTGLPPLGMV